MRARRIVRAASPLVGGWLLFAMLAGPAPVSGAEIAVEEPAAAAPGRRHD